MKQLEIFEIPVSERGLLTELFSDMEDTTITSCLQGRNMGCAWADDPQAPTAAYIQVGGRYAGTCGYSFAAGDAHSPAAQMLVRAWKREWLGDNVIIPQNESWAAVIEREFGEKAVRKTRYATSKHEQHFDAAALKVQAQNICDGYSVRRADIRDYEFFRSCGWASDIALNFENGENWIQNSIAYVAEYDGILCAVAGCYSSYDKGIEIQIETLPQHRRKGLARVCAARLLSECLDRGLYPSWDAANTMSLGLARSLGYVFAGEYSAYEIEAEHLREGV